MESPKKWFDVEDLVNRWEWPQKIVEDLFKERQLLSSYWFKNGVIAYVLESDGRAKISSIVEDDLDRCCYYGLFTIEHYDDIEWNSEKTKGDISKCVLFKVATDGDWNDILEEGYRPYAKTYILKKDLVVTRNNVLKFEAQHNIKIANGILVDDHHRHFESDENTIEEQASKLETLPLYLDKERNDHPKELACTEIVIT